MRLRDFLFPPQKMLMPVILPAREQTIVEPRQPLVRARPGQYLDAQQFSWGVSQDVNGVMAMYAYNNWVMTAVSKLAFKAASAALQVVYRNDPVRRDDKHGLLNLLGEFGRPNDYQDSLEFLEMHFTHLELAGNSFWFWYNDSFAAAPSEVHIVDPRAVKIVPGRGMGIGHYIYTVQGQEFKLLPSQVTHFKRANPYNIYWGMTALQALQIEVKSDFSMAQWNANFFSEDVAMPAGAWVVPPNTKDEELDRMDDELHAKHGGRRKSAIVRGDPGTIAWIPAGVNPRDMDFTEGRMLSRKAVYEALDLPLGLMSEASTEAHARVAERQMADAVGNRHTRTARKINSDALNFWPFHQQRRAMFEDLSIRAADWDRESKRLLAVRPYMSVNEVRTQILRLPPTEGGDDVVLKSDSGADDRGDSRPVQREGQVSNVVESTE